MFLYQLESVEKNAWFNGSSTSLGERREKNWGISWNRSTPQVQAAQGVFQSSIIEFKDPVSRKGNMELCMCGFNAHDQLPSGKQQPNQDIFQFEKAYRSPHVAVLCALWSSTLIEVDGSLMHHGFRPSSQEPVLIEGPPTRNIKTIFGDTSGVLGALTTDGSLHVYHASPGKTPEFKKHRFDSDSFIVRQNLAIDHLAISVNGEVCICTSRPLSLSSYPSLCPN